MYFFDEEQVDFATFKRETVLKKLNGYVNALSKSWAEVNKKPMDWKKNFASYTVNFKGAKEGCKECVEELQKLMKELNANLESPKEFNEVLKKLEKLVDKNYWVLDGNDAQEDFANLRSYVPGSDYANNTLASDLKKADVRSLELTESKSNAP